MGDFATAGRVTNMDRILQVEICSEFGEVIGIVIHIVSVAGLARSSVTSPVMGDDAIAMIQEVHHLGVPVVGRQRPSMRKDDGLATAPIFVIDLRSVFSRDRRHKNLPSSMYLAKSAVNFV